jgi:LemA protein
MEAEGLINAAQAAGLREGIAAQTLAARPAGPAPRASRRGLMLALVLAGAVLALVVYALFAGGDVAEVQNVAETLNRPEELGTMNRSLSALLAAVVALMLPVAVIWWTYNGLVSREEAVLSAWAQTESNFQRRADLVPALVETVSRFMEHERETLTAVTEERTRAAEKLSQAVDGLAARQARVAEVSRQGVPLEDQDRLAAVYEAEAALGKEIDGFLAIAEDYPELRSADQFLELQAQLEGTENRINVTRMRFNEAVRDYNGAIRRLPGSLVASLGDFKRKAYFQAEREAARAPGLDFD